MRCRYCSTMCRELVRPSSMAFCISGIVASPTLKGACGVLVVPLLVHAANAAARMRAQANCFMAGIIVRFSRPHSLKASKGEHLRVLHHQPPSRRLRDVGELRLVVDDEEVAQR